jgi:hypothetical protein
LPRHGAQRRVWNSKHAAERAEDAAGRRCCGQQLGCAGFGEEVGELRGIGRRLVAEGVDQPAFAMGEMESTLSGRKGAPAACLATPLRGVSDGAVSGEVGHQALEAAGRPVQAGPKRDDEDDEAGLLEETARDDGAEAGQDQGEAAGDAGGEVAERERGGGHW